MATKVKLNMKKADTIIGRLMMTPGGPTDVFLASEARRLMDTYVPMQQGILKNTTEVRPGSVTYIQPYAQKQYHENKGTGLRGKLWDVRMMADRGKELRESVARFLGGKAK